MIDYNKKMKRLEKCYDSEVYSAFKTFGSMNERAKLLFTNFLFASPSHSGFVSLLTDNFLYRIWEIQGKKLTPIEEIFVVANAIYPAWTYKEFENIQIDAIGWVLKSQVPIKYGDKKYIADFTIDFYDTTEDDGGEFLNDHPELKGKKYVIELDGHEFHKTKAQRTNDYERENDLKELGYSVVRFTGNQIYNEPLTCVEKMYKIIMHDIGTGGNPNGER